MDHKLAQFLKMERRRQRDLAELRQAKQRLKELKNPDAKLLKAIEDEEAALARQIPII